MPFDTRPLKTSFGIPVPQYFDTALDDWVVLTGDTVGMYLSAAIYGLQNDPANWSGSSTWAGRFAAMVNSLGQPTDHNVATDPSNITQTLKTMRALLGAGLPTALSNGGVKVDLQAGLDRANGAFVVEEKSSYVFYSAGGQHQVKATPGILKRIIISGGPYGSIGVWDGIGVGLSGSTAVQITQLDAPTEPRVIEFGVAFSQALTIWPLANTSVTVVYV